MTTMPRRSWSTLTMVSPRNMAWAVFRRRSGCGGGDGGGDAHAPEGEVGEREEHERAEGGHQGRAHELDPGQPGLLGQEEGDAADDSGQYHGEEVSD